MKNKRQGISPFIRSSATNCTHSLHRQRHVSARQDLSSTPLVVRHSVRVSLFALLLLILLPSIPLAAQTNKRIRQLQQQSATLKKQISESEQLLRTTKKDVNSQLNNLAVINSQITAQQKLVDDYAAEVNTLTGHIGTLQTQIDSLAADLAACKRKYRKALLYMNRNRLLQNRWSFILTAKNFRQMYRRMRYTADYAKYLRAYGQTVADKEAALRQKQQTLVSTKRDRETLLTDAQVGQKQLEGQKTQRQTVINELNKKQKQLQSTITKQRRKQANLNARIDQLIKQEIAAAEARRKKAEAQRRAAEARKKREKEAQERAEAQRRRSASRGGSSKKNKSKPNSNKSKSEATASSTPRYEEEDATDRTLSSNFRANRGRLPIPITGAYAVTSRYGQYNVDGLTGVTLDNKGINLTGHRGAQARSVFGGEVSAVANIGGTFIVIVRHGGYYSVYSNLSSVAVRNGQSVTTRQVLGSVATDASGNATLHFQLRQRSGNSATHINPLPWLAR